MKKIYIIIIATILSYSNALAYLGWETDFWLKDIKKNGGLASRYNSGLTRFLYDSEGNIDFQQKTILTITKIIKKNLSPDLKYVEIRSQYLDQKISEFCLDELLEALIYNNTVTTLIFPQPPTDAAFKIARLLKKNHTLKKIIIVNPEFDDEGAAAIAKALEHNNSLSELNMKNSEFSMRSRKKFDLPTSLRLPTNSLKIKF